MMVHVMSGLDMFADKALIGFLKVLVEINRDKQVIGYRYDKRFTGDSGNFSLTQKVLLRQ